jgi:hypothetical protein
MQIALALLPRSANISSLGVIIEEARRARGSPGRAVRGYGLGCDIGAEPAEEALPSEALLIKADASRQRPLLLAAALLLIAIALAASIAPVAAIAHIALRVHDRDSRRERDRTQETSQQ